MIERIFGAERVNEVINHPSVFPWVASSDEPLDITPIVQNRANVVLFGDHGGFIYRFNQPGLYEVHSQVLPEGRGPWAYEAAQASLKWMFARTDCVEVLTRVPENNAPARALAEKVGMRPIFTNKHGWVKDGQPISADIYSLTIQEWMRIAPGLEKRGEWFHRRLEEEHRLAGKPADDLHDVDAVHDRYVGAACEMVFGGQPMKGIIFYNRWAVMADYAPIEMISTNPVTIDIRTSVIVVRGDDFWMM